MCPYFSGSNDKSIDGYTNAIKTVAYAHSEIHSGSHYSVCDYSLGLSTADELEFAITTPDSLKEVNMLFKLYASDGATLDVYEGASSVVGGTTVTPMNNNRNSANASILTIKYNPTSITDGTKKEGFLAGAGRGESGIASREDEIILKTNETYLFRITSLGNSNSISYCAGWYEHTPKDI